MLLTLPRAHVKAHVTDKVSNMGKVSNKVSNMFLHWHDGYSF